MFYLSFKNIFFKINSIFLLQLLKQKQGSKLRGALWISWWIIDGLLVQAFYGAADVNLKFWRRRQKY